MLVKPEDVVTKHLELFNRGEFEAIAKLFAPDAVDINPLLPEPLRGREAIRKTAETFRRAFPDTQFRFLNTIARNNLVVVEGVMSGTHTGPLEGPTGSIPPTNRRFELPHVRICRVDSQGLIAEQRFYFDPATFFRQLGLSP